MVRHRQLAQQLLHAVLILQYFFGKVTMTSRKFSVSCAFRPATSPVSLPCAATSCSRSYTAAPSALQDDTHMCYRCCRSRMQPAVTPASLAGAGCSTPQPSSFKGQAQLRHRIQSMRPDQGLLVRGLPLPAMASLQAGASWLQALPSGLQRQRQLQRGHRPVRVPCRWVIGGQRAATASPKSMSAHGRLCRCTTNGWITPTSGSSLQW
jgi:hypothetical protein